MATTEQLAWLRHVLELADAVNGMRDIDDPGAVIAAALAIAAAIDDPGVLERDGGQEARELVTLMRGSVREAAESPEGSPAQALLVVVLALAWQGRLGAPEEFVSRVAELLDRWDV